MPSGTILISVTTSEARIPVEGAEVRIGRGAGSSLFFSNESGQTQPFTVQTPPASASRSPGEEAPFATVNVTVRREGFRSQEISGIQIFDGTQTRQNFTLVPALPQQEEPPSLIQTPAQNL